MRAGTYQDLGNFIIEISEKHLGWMSDKELLWRFIELFKYRHTSLKLDIEFYMSGVFKD